MFYQSYSYVTLSVSKGCTGAIRANNKSLAGLMNCFTSTRLLTKEGATIFLLTTLWWGLPHSLVFPVFWKIHLERYSQRSCSLSRHRSSKHLAYSLTSLCWSLRQQSTDVPGFFQCSPSLQKSYPPQVLHMHLASVAPLTNADNRYLKKIYNSYVKESTCIMMWKTRRL